MSIEVNYHNQQAKIENQNLTLEGFLAFVETSFKDLPNNFAFQYLDDESDLVEITCEEDFQVFKANKPQDAIVFVAQLSESSQKVFGRSKCQNKKKECVKAFVLSAVKELLPELVQMVKADLAGKQDAKPTEGDKVVHGHVRCDGCRAFPIVGVRYKCSECPDFDFCESCEASKPHDHAFLKIKKPGQFRMPHQKHFRCQKGNQEKNQHSPMFHPGQMLQQFMTGLFNQFDEVKKQQEMPKEQEQQKQKMREEMERKQKEEMERIKRQELEKKQREEELLLRAEEERKRKELEEQKLKEEQEKLQQEKEEKVVLTPEQEQKLVLLSEVFGINPKELVELVFKFEKIPVDEIVEFVLDDPDFNNVLKRSMMA